MKRKRKAVRVSEREEGRQIDKPTERKRRGETNTKRDLNGIE